MSDPAAANEDLFRAALERIALYADKGSSTAARLGRIARDALAAELLEAAPAAAGGPGRMVRLQGLDNASFGFDELVAEGAAVHIERMDRNHIWLEVRADGREVALWLHAGAATIAVTHETRETAPLGTPGAPAAAGAGGDLTMSGQAASFLAEMASRPCVREAWDPGMSHAPHAWICCGKCDPCKARMAAVGKLDVPA